MLGPFVPLALRLGRIAAALADGVDRVEVEHLGRIAERDTRLLTLSVLMGLFDGRTEEEVNLVNAPDAGRGARDHASPRRRETNARDYADLSASRSSRATSRCASSARRSASCTARTCWRPGASASTSRSTTRT